MIRFDHVSKRYGDRIAVNSLDLEIRAGEVFGFLGPNGAGKTSTLKMLMGLTPITDGVITVGGKDITDDPLAVRRSVRGGRIELTSAAAGSRPTITRPRAADVFVRRAPEP